MTRYDYRKTQAYKQRQDEKPYPFKAQASPSFRRRLVSRPKQKIFTVEEAETRKGLVVRSCPTCRKQFALYRSHCKATKSSYCSTTCYAKSHRVKEYTSKFAGKDKRAVKKILGRKGFYKSHKDEYKNKIVPYADSPTGKAYVGINKSPFMPAADDGHGYQGVLIQDEDREFIQCHSCGKWMQKISNLHLKSCSGLTTTQYKEKYGLQKTTGLVSDETSLRLTKAALKNKFSITQKRNLKKGYPPPKSRSHSMEFFNRHGTCPLQLKTRLIEFIKCNRELPSQNNRGRPIYKALRRRYGEYGHALSAHGLPWMKRQGTNMRFSFPDGTVYKYNINQFHDREELFNLIMEKCPVMHESSSPNSND